MEQENKTQNKSKQPEQKIENKPEVKVEEKKEEQKKETKKQEQVKVKKEESVVRGKDLEISTKHSMAICNLIRFHNPKKMIGILEKVLVFKVAVPFRGEIPHRKKGHRLNKEIAGRYPIAATKVFIKLLKSLNANAEINGMDVDSLKITTAMANRASSPVKPTRIAFGRKTFKRTHVLIIAKETKKETKKQENKK